MTETLDLHERLLFETFEFKSFEIVSCFEIILWPVAERRDLVVLAVIPAKAGIQCFKSFLDSRLRGSDGLTLFFSNLLLGSVVCIDGHILMGQVAGGEVIFKLALV